MPRLSSRPHLLAALLRRDMCHTKLQKTVGSPLPDTKEHGRPTSSSNELVHSNLVAALSPPPEVGYLL
jgi:hypothetical protein